MARRARLASRDPRQLAQRPVLRVAQVRQMSACVARAPLHSPPRPCKDATGPQRAGLTTSGHRCCPSRLQDWVTALTSLDPQNWQIPACLGRNKKQLPTLGTLEEYGQEVKSINKMS